MLPLRFQRPTAVVVVVMLSSLVFGFVDFWGASAGSQALSTRVALQLLAPWYTYRFPHADVVGDAISIVVIDEASIERRNTVYPLPYDEQAALVESITFREAATPAALFIDFVYADDRSWRERRLLERAWHEGITAALGEVQPAAGERQQEPPAFVGDIETFAETLQVEAESGTLVGMRAPALNRAFPPIAIEFAGILVSDEAHGAGAAVAPDTRPLYGVLNELEAPAAPSLFATAPLRYALAPDGRLSAALKLALWACAARVPSVPVPGCPFLGDQYVEEMDASPIVDPTEVEKAAYAAAYAHVAASCALAEADTPQALRDACEREAFTHAARAGWVPNGERSLQRDPPQREQHAVEQLASYASARQSGHFEGALAARACTGDLGSPRRRGMSDETVLESIRASCREGAAKQADARLGPTLTVLWGSGPRDFAKGDGATRAAAAEVSAEIPAAPYIWAEGARDVCAASQVGETTLARLVETVSRGQGALIPALARPPDTCAYHTLVQLDWLGSQHERTVPFVDWAIDGRVVMIGASVAGAGSLEAMRGVSAPGVWAHAMALDNLLTLGNSYRRVVYGSGFENGFWATVRVAGLEALLAFVFALFLSLVWPKTRVKAFLMNCMSTRISCDFVAVFTDVIIAVLFCAIPLLVIAVFMLLIFPWPPLDWIAVSSAAGLAWSLISESKSTS